MKQSWAAALKVNYK